MARPRSEKRRRTILAAAADLVAAEGINAATADVAKRAQVPHGSVFTYFETKAELFNALYLELKTELSEAILRDMPQRRDARQQFRHLWVTWTNWGVANPSKRRALAQLSVSDQITASTRKAAEEAARPAVDVVRQAGVEGALRSAPLSYVGSVVDTMVGATTDHMIREPANAQIVQEAGFEALWRALA